MADAIAIRKKVAELCGYEDINYYAFEYLWKGFKGSILEDIPPYELSLDAITQAFDEHGLTYTLQKQNYKDTGGSGYIAVNGVGGTHYSDTAAKAMCYLFIHCMEKKEL